MKRLIAVLSTAVCLLAQSERGDITGGVSDSTSAAVPNASVVIRHRATNIAVRLYNYHGWRI